MLANHSRIPGALALSYQEVLTAAARLRWKRQDPRDTAIFRRHCRQALDSGVQDARDAGYTAETVRSATFAVAAFLDETVALACDARFSDWLREPLENEIFRSRNGVAGFYRNLREVLARPDGQECADLAEVHLLCLMLGFADTLPPGGAERKTWLQQTMEKVRRVRGPLPELSPRWRIPAGSRSAVRRRPAVGEGTAPEAPAVDSLVREAEGRLALLGATRTLATNPVLLVLGEPGSVKTSTILHCGARSDHLAGEVYRDGNISPTETANFWYTRPSAVVEVGTLLLADRAKWCRLLERLRPAGGEGRAALVCFDSERLTRTDSGETIERSARYLRQHLEEYARAAGGAVPVYVLFTRGDHVPGFPEFVRKLTHEEGAAALGATLPEFPGPDDSASSQASRLKEAWQGLFRALVLVRTEVMARMADGRNLQAAYEFPREFHKLKPAAVRFLSELCPPAGSAAPFLRGFYFSGARPIVVEENGSRVPTSPEALSATAMFSEAVPAAARPAARANPRRKIPQWLFLGRLFHEVLLSDYLGGRG